MMLIESNPMRMQRRGWSLATVLTIVLVSACANIFGSGRRDDLREAEQRWAERGPVDYNFTMQRSCFCGHEVLRPVRIVVENRSVVARRYADDDSPVPAQFDNLFPAIEGVFDIVRDAIARKAVQLDVTYDPQLGHPVDVAIDYSRNVIDEELSLAIRNVQ